jgi:DNA-binding CsgD family transcriptional regulator
MCWPDIGVFLDAKLADRRWCCLSHLTPLQPALALESPALYLRAMTTAGDAVSSVRLVGRDIEIDQIEAALDGLSERGGAFVVQGQPGIGKSSLLDHACHSAEASGARVLRTLGTENEAELAFAGLHELIRPLGDFLVALPAPRRLALDAAFGIAHELEPEPFHVALAAYQLICEASDASPTLIAVDDAHWLDRASLGVLAFMARRLQDEPVLLLAAVRDGYGTALDEARLPALRLEPLPRDAAAELLEVHAPQLSPPVREHILDEAAGNPLGLVELARSLPGNDRPRPRFSPGPVALTARLKRAFAGRLDELSSEARLVLLAAALDRAASVDELLTCASLVAGSPVTISAIDRAVAFGIVDAADWQLRFRHPLMRSAVEESASLTDLLATYRELAGVTADPERRLWHRAMAAVGHDEELADALDAHAQDARSRGAVTVAASALERAATLTADSHKTGERLVRAAELAYELGDVHAVRRLLTSAQVLEVGDFESARLAWLQEMVAGDMWFEAGATKTFVTIARRMLDGGDADMALGSLVPIAHRCWWTRTRPRTRKYLVEAAVDSHVSEDDPRLLAVLALADPEVTAPSVRSHLANIRVNGSGDPVSTMLVGIAAEKTGDFAQGVRFLARAVEQLREQGRLGVLTQALVHYAWAATHVAEWESAAAAAAEAALLARDSRQPQYGLTAELVAALVTAMRGTGENVDQILSGPERTLIATKSGPLLAPAHLARGAAALGDGRHEEAFRHLWPVFDPNHTAFHRFMRWPAILDLAEAAGSTEHVERVLEVADELAAIADACSAPVLIAGLACARPLLAADADAEPQFVAALAHDLRDYPFLRARLLFSFGRWLRRQRRGLESREPLHAATDMFDALGAMRWGQRARQELRATGEKISRRSPDARDRLTPQELQIAELAAGGFTNREIGERLFLSHRTIGSHLYRIFPKLEVTSRAQLRAALERSSDDREAVS